ncbi:peptidoglycan DD-metalloendopeptidase family protein [Actibacterium sp. XHP0104]|uniref:peptidoglycan DD-metalloendopeptidase family protein n=1 Tax=Actibacterium sp. XHP0104 TaxID=2984335 RepID=UPI0021E83489|nr:peptidoglycan DD-metalloendopeptidase family protein [Actibacterium sp. XHP0104]MCV2880714.1 peptidoglycan DD-metalloendopeptidase family protein [Actibacterium sp. XHP0104]
MAFSPRMTLPLVALMALTACNDFDIDLRPGGASTAAAARETRMARPEPDARGVISYPTYQVAVAQRGDTVDDVAMRLGLSPEELSRYNGINRGAPLREGELLALPNRVEEPSPLTGSITTGPIQSADSIDITTLAGGAIERADGGQTGVATTTDGTMVAVGPEPIRHRVERGESAYSIARRYDVTVRSLAEWNALGPGYAVREGQYLLIPTGTEGGFDTAAATPPGGTSPVPTPPSAARPLPRDEAPRTAPVAVPQTDLSEDKSDDGRMTMPVNGSIIRAFEAKKNEGIDIAASAGSPVKAAASGTVAAITRDTEQVPILVIRHDDSLLTVYANIDNITVSKGDKVSRGQTIAAVRGGAAPFLHFEVREGFDSVDPMPYLN